MTDIPATIVHNLDRGRRLYGGRPLLTAGSRAVSYAEFAGLVEGAAARLARRGTVIAALRERLSRLELRNVYGLTETAGLLTMLDDAEIETRPGSAGRLVPGAEIRLDGDSELLASGPMITGGYWRNETATRASFRDGWLQTGDRACIDPGGYLRILGRADEMINRGSGKIAPADVEHAPVAHPAVAEAAAFGVPDKAAGQAVACVVLAPGARVTVTELRAWLRPRLPVHARPRLLRIVAGLPRGRTGKIDTAALRSLVYPDL
jgi:acyl-CoA synthetase (AMP-forming)/AMP-acid ligase II